jgi:hypothetical protein
MYCCTENRGFGRENYSTLVSYCFVVMEKLKKYFNKPFDVVYGNEGYFDHQIFVN